MKTFSKLTGLLAGILLWQAVALVLTGACLFLSPGTNPVLVYVIAAAVLLAAGAAEMPRGALFAISQIGTRMMFDNARTLMTSLGYDLSQAKLTQSYLRSEVAMSTAVANYHIPILVNDTQNGAVRACEKRLNLQDIFVTNQLGIFVGVGAATSTVSKLYTYGNATIFTSATDLDLMSIYNGNLQLIINNDQVLPAWDVLRHYKVPIMQELAVLYYASSPTMLDAVDFSEDGFYPVEPGLVMNGAANLQMSLQCPGAPATVVSNGFIAVIQRGILLQNVTTVK